MSKQITPELKAALYGAAANIAGMLVMVTIATIGLKSCHQAKPLPEPACIQLPASPSWCAKQTSPTTYCNTGLGICVSREVMAEIIRKQNTCTPNSPSPYCR